MLYIPGNDRKKIKKGAETEADAIILDMEDSVPVNGKETARSIVKESIKTISSENKEVCVRVNSPETEFFEKDVDETICKELDGVMLPKSERGEDVKNLNEKIDKTPSGNGLFIVPLIETCKGIMNLKEIVTSSDNIDALAFGAVDYTSNLGAEISDDEIELLYPRSKIANICSAFEIQAVDTPWTDISDKEGLTEECKLARKLGYDGKQAIHPYQLKIINEIFSPSEEEIKYSKKVVNAFEKAERKEKGTATLDGEMIDIAHYKKAKRILKKAEAAGNE